MWRELISRLVHDAEFFPPASTMEIEAAERLLGERFPTELVELLLESNGVFTSYGAHTINSTQEIVEINREHRDGELFQEIYKPFDGLLFFGEAGNGDKFAFAISGEHRIPHGVFVWDHEDDSRRWYANSLHEYVDLWIGDKKPI